MSARYRLSMLSAAIGAMLVAAAPASAQTVSEVAVSGHSPTSITVSVAGKSARVVRREVHVAARTVCRNAISNSELHATDLRWCKSTSAAKALRRYAAIGRYAAGAPTSIVLSLR